MSGGRNVRVAFGAKGPDGRKGVRLETPYGERFVDELKRVVPHRDRSWDPDAKVWWVSEEHGERASLLVVKHFGETVVVLADGTEEYRDASGVTATQERLL